MRDRFNRSRQKARFVFSVIAFTILCIASYVLGTSDEEGEWPYQGEFFIHKEETTFKRGEIVEFSNKEEVCTSYVLPPGINLLSDTTLAFVYLGALIYLFLGISIVSDIFMGSIEEITSKTTIITVFDKDIGKERTIRGKVWNPTIANLTLMALGSSAPEILLSIIETLQTLGVKPGELGPSTIVGSAAFNLLVISAVSIMAVNDG